MQILKSLPALRSFIAQQRSQKHSIGFVPTMGALHQGHLSLIANSVKENDCTVASIYINPTQFNNLSDFEKYPKSVNEDAMLLESNHCDALFLPDSGTMYPQGTPQNDSFQISFGSLEKVMEGEFRNGHFNGVAMVVSKLFNMVTPDIAYFGQKDYQQFLIIDRLTKALSFNLEVKSCAIVRENSGLAMSSRNRRLTAEQAKEAANIYKCLQTVAATLQSGKSYREAIEAGKSLLSNFNNIQLEYLQIADAADLKAVSSFPLPKNIFIGIAAFLGEVRLIDNMLVENA